MAPGQKSRVYQSIVKEANEYPLGMIIIETSSNRSFIILAEQGQPIAFLPLTGGETLSKNLALRVQELLDAHPSFRAETVAVGIGPGSYTGIRVGAALAKALAYGWQVPILTFCSLHAFLPPQMGPFTVLVDGYLGEVHGVQGERSETGVLFASAEKIATLDPFADRILVSPHPEAILKRLSSTAKIYPAEPDALFLAQDCAQKAPRFAQSPVEPFAISY